MVGEPNIVCCMRDFIKNFPEKNIVKDRGEYGAYLVFDLEDSDGFMFDYQVNKILESIKQKWAETHKALSIEPCYKIKGNKLYVYGFNIG